MITIHPPLKHAQGIKMTFAKEPLLQSIEHLLVVAYDLCGGRVEQFVFFINSIPIMIALALAISIERSVVL